MLSGSEIMRKTGHFVISDEVRHNLATGAICRVNIGIAAVGGGAIIVTEDGAKIFAALATGLWFTTQTVLAVVSFVRKRRVSR